MLNNSYLKNISPGVLSLGGLASGSRNYAAPTTRGKKLTAGKFNAGNPVEGSKLQAAQPSEHSGGKPGQGRPLAGKLSAQPREVQRKERRGGKPGKAKPSEPSAGKGPKRKVPLRKARRREDKEEVKTE
jgi:hypothetical protein